MSEQSFKVAWETLRLSHHLMRLWKLGNYYGQYIQSPELRDKK